MIHESHQGGQLVASFYLRIYRSWAYGDRYRFVIPHAQHECSLRVGAQHKRLVTLVENSEHEQRNIAYP